MALKFTPSRGNVFTDLGFPRAEAENLKARSSLMTALTVLIRERRLTQVRAAKMFGVSQPRVSNLMRGRIDRFSVDTLVEMLGHAGARVEIMVRRPDQRRGKREAGSAAMRVNGATAPRQSSRPAARPASRVPRSKSR